MKGQPMGGVYHRDQMKTLYNPLPSQNQNSQQLQHHQLRQ